MTSKQEHGKGLLSIFEKSPKRFKRIKFLGELFKSGGFELRIAGGAVRDILLGNEPKDIDFATTALPDQSLDLVQRHDNIMRIIITPTGMKHGTIAVKFKEAEIDFKRIKLASDNSPVSMSGTDLKEPEYDDESPYEITTLRWDDFTDGRHAEVRFIDDWKLDAERRDLTINSMFLTLDEGKLVDFFGGQSDLENQVVKFVGDADRRMKEDYLRILRFYRFWSRYGRENQPDDVTLSTIETNLPGLDQISGERIWVEVKKIFGTLPCYDVINLMLRSEIFKHMGISKIKSQPIDIIMQEVKQVHDNVVKFRDLIDQKAIQQDDSGRRLVDLIHVILFSTVVHDLDDCQAAHKRMKFSNIERDSLIYIIQNRKKMIGLQEMKKDIALSPKSDIFNVTLKTKMKLIYQGSFTDLQHLSSWQLPTFPLRGTLVVEELQRRKLLKVKPKVAVEYLKEAWADSDFKMSEDDLKLKLSDFFDKIEQDT